MPEVWAGVITVAGLAALLAGAVAGAVAGWLTVILLVHPVRARGMPGVLDLQGVVSARAVSLSAFATRNLVVALPQPRHFFEQLGPDRFRREFGRSLKARIDEHVDDVMSRRNERVWGSLSVYARNRVYAHVHRRLPYVVDDFVDSLQGELDDLVQPTELVRRHLIESPETVAATFLAAFGAGLRSALPLSALAGLLVGGLLLWLGVGGVLLTVLTTTFAAACGSWVMLLVLARPRVPGGIWPWRAHGILYRRRREFLRGLATRIANDALSWRALVGEFFGESQASRVRQVMRRQVSSIIDAPVFKATLQFLVGAEGVVAVKTSAVEKALEVLSSTPVSAALREHYRVEVERTLLQAADDVSPEAYESLWRDVLRPAWRVLPVLLAVGGLAAGVVITQLAGVLAS